MKFLVILMLGVLFQCNLSATGYAQANSQRIQDEAGTLVEIKPDGTKVIERSDGTLINIKPDGSKYIKERDGTTIQINADGSKTITKQDGTVIQVPKSK